MNRRHFLISAGATGLVAATGVTAFALTRTPTAALAPWAEAAANATGSPPLRPEPRGSRAQSAQSPALDHRAHRPADHDPLVRPRPPPAPDRSHDRQILIGLACFTEMAAIAATAIGYRLEVEAFPAGEPGPRLDQRPIAHWRLVREAGLAADPLFQQIPHRRSTKRPFDMTRPVPPRASRPWRHSRPIASGSRR